MENVNKAIGDNSLITDQIAVSEASFKDEVLRLVNEHRETLGLKSLKKNNVLEQVATKHALDMAEGVVSFGHTGMTGRCSYLRLQLGGGNLCGEIVASGQKGPQEVFRAWLNSYQHQAHLENSRYTLSGVGFARASNGKIFWTQMFLELN